MKLPGYKPPDRLEHLLLLRFFTLNIYQNRREKDAQMASDRNKTAKTIRKSIPSVKEILKLEKRMCDLNCTVEYDEDARCRLADEA